MMEENNIFLDGGVLAIHLVRTYLMTYSSTPSPCTHLYTFGWPLPIPPVAYLLNGWPILNTKTNKNIQISYSLKYKLPKKNFLQKNKWQRRMKITFRGAVLIKTLIMQSQLCFGAKFVKKTLAQFCFIWYCRFASTYFCIDFVLK